MTDLSRTPVTLIGASRGLGRVLAETFHRLGAQVLVVARGQAGLDALARDLPGVAVLACDASAADTPDRVFAAQARDLDSVRSVPCRRAVPSWEVDWEEFSGNWNNDVRMSFHFLQATLKRPLPLGTIVVTITSGAVRQGSPISGGYAGAKQMQIFMTGYAQKAADRAGLDLRFCRWPRRASCRRRTSAQRGSRAMPPITAPAKPPSSRPWGRSRRRSRSPMRCSN